MLVLGVVDILAALFLIMADVPGPALLIKALILILLAKGILSAATFLLR